MYAGLLGKLHLFICLLQPLLNCLLLVGLSTTQSLFENLDGGRRKEEETGTFGEGGMFLDLLDTLSPGRVNVVHRLN